jgi:tetratricopeptide (TPR) repeat protein
LTKLDKANEHLKRKEFSEARALLEELVREEPDNAGGLYNLGMLYTELGDPKKAVKTLLKCVDLGQDTANVYVALGYAYSRMRNQNKAQELFLTALELEPDNSYALRNLGGLYGKEADYERAIQYLERAFRVNPKDAHTAYGLGMSYFSKGDIGSADFYLKKTVEIDPSSETSEMAKDLLREIAALSLKAEGFRTDAMFYCISAINLFDRVGPAETKRITLEIGLKGQRGLDINNPDKKYTLNSLQGAFTGLQLVSYMYVGFKRIASGMDVGINLSEEYDMALNFIKLKRSHGHTFN